METLTALGLYLKHHADTLGILIALVGILITLIVLLWTSRDYIAVKKTKNGKERFKTYHELVRDIVQAPPGQAMSLDRQIAIAYELRHFPEYYHLSRRILRGLRTLWAAQNADKRLITEIDFTLNYINKRVKPEGPDDV
jgi:hypothetical protein